ncbi:hypothetical protein P8452_75246 [Trifolium repens]|nr:hypothetical protein P8452_75246 [Trifolium repens]
MADYLASKKAALKIIESYMEGYRQDWKLSFEKDTVIRGDKEELLLLVLEKVTSHIFTSFAHTLQEKHVNHPDIEKPLICGVITMRKRR